MASAALLFPPWLFGRVARRWSRQVGQLYLAGDVEGARNASSRAMAWGLVGIAVGSLVLLLVAVLV
jgi:hypothetical protein